MKKAFCSFVIVLRIMPIRIYMLDSMSDCKVMKGVFQLYIPIGFCIHMERQRQKIYLASNKNFI